MKVLIGYDGSDYSDAAISDLKLAGLPRQTEVKVVSVADLLMSSPEISEVLSQTLLPGTAAAALGSARSVADRVTEEARSAAENALKELQARYPGWHVQSEAMTGTPAWTLIDAADEWNTDLVIVGSQGRSGLKRWLLGSVSKRVVTDSNASVRVARPRLRKVEDAPPRLIIGVDGSPAAEQAIYSVGQRVWPEGTEVRLVAVDDGALPSRIAVRLPQAAAMIESYFQQKGERVSSMLKWATNEFSMIGLNTSVVTEKGDAIKVLLGQAAAWDADSIFVGTRDFKSGFERFRLGSVSTAVVTNANCSVEVVRPPRTELVNDNGRQTK